jgi:hypothetical protein
MTEDETMQAWRMAKAKMRHAANVGMGRYNPTRDQAAVNEAHREGCERWIEALDTAAKWMLSAKPGEKVRAAKIIGRMISEGPR